MKIANIFFVLSFITVLRAKYQGKWIKSIKTGARERSITKFYFISGADSPLKLIEESAFKDDQTGWNTKLDQIHDEIVLHN